MLGLACFRLVRLFLYDQIFAGLRNLFLRSDETGDLYTASAGWRFVIGYVLTCPWCAGIWCAALIVCAYEWLPQAHLLIAIIAVAGLAALFHDRME